MLSILKKIFFPELNKKINPFKEAASYLDFEFNYKNKDLYITEYEKEKLNFLKKYGFVNLKFVVETEDEIEKINYFNKMKNVVNYFNKKYPKNNFVSYGQIKKICQEKDFIFCKPESYKKHLPEHNYHETKKFNLQEVDCFYYGVLLDPYNSCLFGTDEMQHIYQKGYEISNKKTFDIIINNQEIKLHNKKIYYDKFPILICTQEYNLNLSKAYNPKFGYTAVLQPVIKDSIYGFLIITVIEDSEAII